MKQTVMALFMGMALLAAPAAKACDMEKTDTKVMNHSKHAKVAKHGKAGQKTAQQKTQDAKI